MGAEKKIPISVVTALISGVVIIIAALIGVIPTLRSPEKLSAPTKETQIANKPIVLNAPFLVPVYYYPSGWMGDGEEGKKYMSLNTYFRGKTRQGDNDNACIKIIYQPGPKRWAGIFWQYPDGNWGDQPGRNIKEATKITFWASGEKGDEAVEFKAGGIKNFQKRYQDSFEISLGRVTLTNKWKKYEISLAGQNLSSVIGAFAWVATGDMNLGGLTFYLDDIRYE